MGRSPSQGKSTAKTGNFGLIMAVYLLGLVVGGLYVGMVAPVRTVVQSEFQIGNVQGIWMITIYALFYASFIPVIGKLADRRGRKPVFLACMATFCCGAAICGVSEWVGKGTDLGLDGGYVLLLAGRVLQAIGACGIIPLANAEIGTAAPPDKRGFALGITAAASGLSNVLGAGVGSAIIGVVGLENWPVLFYACIPFGILAFVGGVAFLPKGSVRETGKMDIAGAASLVATIFLFLLGIQFASEESLPGVLDLVPGGVATVFGAAVLALAVFMLVERRASDPVLPPRYFQYRPIVITLGVSLFIGGMINSMTLVPEFTEAALGMQTGSGGVFMMVIGVFSLAGPPIGGKLIDRFGPKPVLMAGLSVATVGYILLAASAAMMPTLAMIVAGLAVMGLGLGFCMGAPVNYMILQNVSADESNSGIAAATLVRQVGLSIAPALYVSFITVGHGASGYTMMFVATAASSVAALVLMLFYRK